tara:strand:- start:1798 stop:1956 length:159 start_codon:yes stop_codon:yes gene_type:complete
MSENENDFVIIGVSLSGIGAAYHLARKKLTLDTLPSNQENHLAAHETFVDIQ